MEKYPKSEELSELLANLNKILTNIVQYKEETKEFFEKLRGEKKVYKNTGSKESKADLSKIFDKVWNKTCSELEKHIKEHDKNIESLNTTVIDVLTEAINYRQRLEELVKEKEEVGKRYDQAISEFEKSTEKEITEKNASYLKAKDTMEKERIAFEKVFKEWCETLDKHKSVMEIYHSLNKIMDDTITLRLEAEATLIVLKYGY